jgi:hypothetical protein
LLALLRDETDTADRVFISIVVIGSVAKDNVTPAVDLKLLINNVRGQQEFDFPKGNRMNRIDAVFPLNGALNKYPFDCCGTTVWLLMTTPARNVQPQASKAPGSTPEITHQIDELAVSSSALQHNAPVAIRTVRMSSESKSD